MLKKVVVTGANSGIGLASAKKLAQSGFDVIAVCRSEAKGKAAVEEIKAVNDKVEVNLYLCDLSDLLSVANAADAIREAHPQIDVLLNNAGYYPPSVSYIGVVEKCLYASHLGHMLFTLKLMPALEAVPDGRIINVSSAAHNMGKAERFFKKVDNLSNIKAYGDAKLANILFSMGLRDRTAESITSYSLHPGVVRTNFGENLSGFFKGVFNLISPLILSPDGGARTSVHLATAPLAELKPHNGRYFDKSKPKKTRHKDIHKSKSDWLWAKSMDYFEDFMVV